MVEPTPTQPEIHDAVHQANLLRDILESDKTPLGCFLGAGCPLGIYDDAGEKSVVHIPDVPGLTKKVRETLERVDNDKDTDSKLVPLWDKLIEECRDDDNGEPNVEDILSELRTLHGRRGKGDIDGVSKERLATLDVAICDTIVDEVGKDLPSYRCCYNRFASWAGGIQRLTPLEIFTPNYDLLIEEAFERLGLPLFDGFIGSRQPFFDITSIELDEIPVRWSRLWKIHGSVNWQRRDDGGVLRVSGRAQPGKAMIYPSHLKYDQSRRMPYLAMLDRLKAFFRRPTTSPAHRLGPPVLIVCGYSFSDDHINEVLLDGLKSNPSVQCFVLEYKTLAESARVIKHGQNHRNLTVLARDGAVVGSRIGLYNSDSTIGEEHSPWLHEEVSPADGNGDPTKQIRCRLGDFHYFGLFVEQIRGAIQDDSLTTEER